MKWENSPQYLKSIRKIQAMDPQDRAIASTLIDELDAMYAGQDMKNQLQAMRSAALEKERDRRYNLAKESFDYQKQMGETELDMAKDAQKYAKNQMKTAQNLGWANVGLSGLFGASDLMNKRGMAKKYKSLAEIY